MQADGFSLDDKRTPTAMADSELLLAKCLKNGDPIPEEIHKTNNIPDILQRWKSLRHSPSAISHCAESQRSRTDRSFLVPASEIAANDYDLSINRYKEVEYEEVHYDPPKKILSGLMELEDEIAKGMKELERML